MVGGGGGVAGRRRSGMRNSGLVLALALLAILLSAVTAAATTYLPVGERYMPRGIAIDPTTGVIYSGDSDGSVCRLLSVNATGIPQIFAGGSGRCETGGDGGPAFDAEVEVPEHLAVDGSGNVYTASGYTLRRISASTGRITAWAGRQEYTCLSYFWTGPTPRVGAVAAEVAFYIQGMAVDPISGHLFVLSACNKGIWEIDASGVIVAEYGGETER
jgi:hypothetical protein